MTSQYRHRRTSSPSTAFPNPLEPGEIAVNTANRQIAVGDAQTGVIGAPLPLLALRYFDTRAIYAFNDMVVIGGNIQRALVANGPGGFNQTQWTPIAGPVDPRYVAKAGDTMTGPLVLPGDPVNPLEAADKSYVDALIAAKSSVIVSDTPPVGVIDNTLWFESDTGFTYLMFNDGTSRQWVLQAGPPPDTSQFVQRTGDTMSGKLIAPALQAATLATASYSTPLSIDASVLNLQSLSGGIVTAPTMSAGNNTSAVANTTFVQNAITTYAAPFDAMAYSGMQINGSCEVDQPNAGAVVTFPSGAKTLHLLDGWQGYKDGTSTFTVQQVASIFPGYSKELKLTVTTAQASIGGNIVDLHYMIEGYRASRLVWGTTSAQPLTIGFWYKSSVAGPLQVYAVNSAGDVVAGAVVNVTVGTIQFATATFPGQTSGVWLTDNRLGIQLFFRLAGSISINIVGTVGNTFEMTGVVVLPGIEAPSAARSPFIMRPYDQELVTCKRYLWRPTSNDNPYTAFAVGYFLSTTTVLAVMQSPVEFRAAPTVTFSPLATWAASAINADVQGTTHTRINFTTNTSAAAGSGTMLSAAGTTAAWIMFDARL